jgi:hypothetical protein
MCNEKCGICHDAGCISSEIEGTETNHTVNAPCPQCNGVDWNPFPWIDGKLIDPAEERKIKREFERDPGSFVSREG